MDVRKLWSFGKVIYTSASINTVSRWRAYVCGYVYGLLGSGLVNNDH